MTILNFYFFLLRHAIGRAELVTYTFTFLILYSTFYIPAFPTFSHFHSVLKLFTGFANAVVIARYPTVIHAINIDPPIAIKNIDAPNGMR